MMLDYNDSGPSQGVRYSLYFAGEYKKDADCTSRPIYKINLRNPCRIVTAASTPVSEMNETIATIKEDTLWGEDVHFLGNGQTITGDAVTRDLYVEGAEYGEYFRKTMVVTATSPASDSFRGKSVSYDFAGDIVYQSANCPIDAGQHCDIYVHQSDVYACCDSHPGAHGCPLDCNLYSGPGFTDCCTRYPNGLGCSPLSTGVQTDCNDYSDPADHAACCTFQGNTGC